MSTFTAGRGTWRIAFEGTDGAGKSLQVARTTDWLVGEGCEVRLPTSDRTRPIRALYRHLIRDDAQRFLDARTSVLLGLADYADVLAEEDAGTTRAGTVSLFDRYAYSPMADAMALGMPREQVLGLASMFPAPDVTFVLTLDPHASLQRKGTCSVAEAGGPEFVSRHGDVATSFVDYQTRVRDAFHLIADAQPRAGFVIVDAAAGPDDVFARIQLELIGRGVLAGTSSFVSEGPARV